MDKMDSLLKVVSFYRNQCYVIWQVKPPTTIDNLAVKHIPWVSIKASYQCFITTCRASHHCLYSLQVGSCLGIALRPFFWGTATQYTISSHLWKQLLKSLY